jgi:hypothetical protein
MLADERVNEDEIVRRDSDPSPGSKSKSKLSSPGSTEVEHKTPSSNSFSSFLKTFDCFHPGNVAHRPRAENDETLPPPPPHRRRRRVDFSREASIPPTQMYKYNGRLYYGDEYYHAQSFLRGKTQMQLEAIENHARAEAEREAAEDAAENLIDAARIRKIEKEEASKYSLAANTMTIFDCEVY